MQTAAGRKKQQGGRWSRHFELGEAVVWWRQKLG